MQQKLYCLGSRDCTMIKELALLLAVPSSITALLIVAWSPFGKIPERRRELAGVITKQTKANVCSFLMTML